MTRLAAILTLLALAGCGTAPAAKSQAVDLGAEATLAPGATASVNTTQFKGGNSVVGTYRVTLVRVEPAPRSTARIVPQDYRATIVVEKTT